MHSRSILQTLTKWQGSKRRLYLKCAGVGLASGLVVVAYRLALSHLEDMRTAGWFVLLAGVGLLLGWMARRVWMVRGSGIPQVKGVLLRQLRMQWLKELLLKFTGGCLAIGAGLSLGREGPSIQLGAQVGAGFSRRASFPLLEERYLVSAGASAGLAAAFNAPLAGVLFALEELHKSFSPVMLTCLMIASISADLVSRHFFGLGPVFDLRLGEALPLLLLLIAGKLLFTAASYGTGAPGGGAVRPGRGGSAVHRELRHPEHDRLLHGRGAGADHRGDPDFRNDRDAVPPAGIDRRVRALLLRMLKAQGLSPPPGDADKKLILTIPVRLGSALEHKELRELELPEDCFLVGILRGAVELLPRPRLEILPGDSLAVLTSEDRASQVKPVLLAMGAPAEAEHPA